VLLSQETEDGCPATVTLAFPQGFPQGDVRSDQGQTVGGDDVVAVLF
jgi:hypothetical protein